MRMVFSSSKASEVASHEKKFQRQDFEGLLSQMHLMRVNFSGSSTQYLYQLQINCFTATSRMLDSDEGLIFSLVKSPLSWNFNKQLSNLRNFLK
jgi:hypothetical protein